MEILFETARIWEIDTDVGAVTFIEALWILLNAGDVIVFGVYEPTPELICGMVGAGAVVRDELAEFFTSFALNRDEHPSACAFELVFAPHTMAELVRLGSSVLRQLDKDDFFDHVLAYRPTVPKTPLFSFHDAFNGGTLLLSETYDEDAVRLFSSGVEGAYAAVGNPCFHLGDADGSPKE